MNNQRFDVVVVGNVGIDTNVYLPGADIDFDVESNFTENLDYVGQAGGYAARGYAQLGKKTAFVGYVGDDHNGRFIREEFARDGTGTSTLFVDPSGSSRSINFMYRHGRRRNLCSGNGCAGDRYPRRRRWPGCGLLDQHRWTDTLCRVSLCEARSRHDTPAL